jgi:hypothetical protein
MSNRELTGFTLFYNPSKKCWQKSIRYEGEVGWSVTHVSEKTAETLLRDLQYKVTDHPKDNDEKFRRDFGKALRTVLRRRGVPCGTQNWSGIAGEIMKEMDT